MPRNVNEPLALPDATSERGQIFVLVALGLIAMIAMVGLVLDGGSAFAQRRAQQNGADLAAIAGANAYMNTPGGVGTKTVAATDAAQASATQNDLQNGTASTVVGVTVTLLSSGAQVKVDISKPHQNNFARVVGMNSWDVSVTATAISGSIDTAVGAAPWLMSIDAFNASGTPKYTVSNPQDFGEQNGDYPVSALDISWTDFNGSNNVNTAEVSGIIDGSNVVTSTIGFEQYIGQSNQGNHTALFGDVDGLLRGKTVPIPVVGPGSPNCAAPQQSQQNGCFKGWALFTVISADQGGKKIRGYFTGNFVRQPLTVGECTPAQQAAGTCGVIAANPFGAYVVRLTD